MSDRPDGGKPRLSIVVAAWDRVDQVTFDAGPEAYIAREYPLLAGRLRNPDRLEIATFGLSVVGGDLKDDVAFRDAFLEGGLDQHGWVAVRDPGAAIWRKEPDLTLPIAWAIGD